MADVKDPRDDGDNLPIDFKELSRNLVIGEIRAMIRRLQESGEFQIPNVDFDKLDLRGLNYIKRQLRDTLRTLGGGR